MATAKNALQRLLDCLCSLLLCRRRRTAASKGPRVVVVRQSRTAGHATAPEATTTDPPAAVAPVTIRLATFNAAMFSISPAVPPAGNDNESSQGLARAESGRRRPKKGILKSQSRRASPPNYKPLRVSINIQDDEITDDRSRSAWKGKAAVVESSSSASRLPEWRKSSSGRARSVAEVLREVGADIIGLQNVRADQERGLRPLSELAEGLGMRYVFAESWAPEYGNAVLSRWPIKRWRAHRIADQSDFSQLLHGHESKHDARCRSRTEYITWIRCSGRLLRNKQTIGKKEHKYIEGKFIMVLQISSFERCVGFEKND